MKKMNCLVKIPPFTTAHGSQLTASLNPPIFPFDKGGRFKGGFKGVSLSDFRRRNNG